MITKNKSLEERTLEIFERDIVNGGEVLILKAYCVKVDNGMWSCPAPQIFNETIYNNYREEYDAKIQAFRNDCINNTNTSSLVIDEIEQLKKDNEIIMNAVAELSESINVGAK